MFQSFENKAFLAICKAEEKATNYNLSYIGTEHLLIGISYQTNTFASNLLKKYGLSSFAIETVLTNVYMDHNIDILKKDGQYEDLQSFLKNSLSFKKLNSIFIKNRNEKKEEPTFTPKLRNIFRKCYLYSYRRIDVVTVELLLAILLLRQDGFLRDVLRQFQVPIDSMINELHFYLRQDRLQHYRIVINDKVIRFPANLELANKITDSVMKILYKEHRLKRYEEIKFTVKKRLNSLQKILNDKNLLLKSPEFYDRKKQEYENFLKLYNKSYKKILQKDSEGRQIYRRFILRQKRDFLDKDIPIIGRLIDEIQVQLGFF
jgi:ATP-dependent Clp protease ATP-binding subunit ClpA